MNDIAIPGTFHFIGDDGHLIPCTVYVGNNRRNGGTLIRVRARNNDASFFYDGRGPFKPDDSLSVSTRDIVDLDFDKNGHPTF